MHVITSYTQPCSDNSFNEQVTVNIIMKCISHCLNCNEEFPFYVLSKVKSFNGKHYWETHLVYKPS